MRPHQESNYSEELVLRVNELFHDLTNDVYSDIHSEMDASEKTRWQRVAGPLLDVDHPVTVADVGTGTGFVPLTIAGFLKEKDRFICSDISKGMLKAARENIAAMKFCCRFDFMKIESSAPMRLPFETGTVDVLTMNSVLHHVKNTREFLAEIDRTLKPGGVVMIGHEPNRHFHEHPLVWYGYRLLNFVFNPKNGAIGIARRLGLYKPMMGFYYVLFPSKRKTSTEMMERINRTLLQERLIERPLELEEIADITDILDMEGFAPERLAPGYELVYLETHDYLRIVNHKYPRNPIVRSYEKMMSRRFPGKGGTFFVALRKKK